MKRKMGALLTLLMAFMLIQPLSAATQGINIELDGKEVNYPEAFIENGRTLVPLAFFDQIASKIAIDDTVIVIEGEYTSVTLTIGEQTALVHHKYDFTGIPLKVQMDVAPKRVGEVNFIPLRLVAETLDVKINWDSKTNTAMLFTKEALNKPISYSVIDPKVTLMTEELNSWFYSNVEVKGIEYKIIGEYTYIKVQAGEMPTGGYEVYVNGLYHLSEGKVLIETNTVTPSTSDMVIQILTYPSALIEVKTSDLPIKDSVLEIVGEIK